MMCRPRPCSSSGLRAASVRAVGEAVIDLDQHLVAEVGEA